MIEDVLIVGQTPPPMHGQSVMVKGLLDGKYDGIRFHHVRMRFSRSINEAGAFQLRKLLLLFVTWAQIVLGRLKSRARILYFPPSGPTLIPVIRDIILLLGTRWMFRYTVFHFHAAGLTEIYPRLPRILKPFYNLAYRNPDLAIFTANSRTSVGVELGAKAIAVAPYGIQDFAGSQIKENKPRRSTAPCILFVGILCEGKGLMTLIDACSLLRKKNIAFRVVCIGAWGAGTTSSEVEALIENHRLKENFCFPGVLLGEDKWLAFKEADIFCFPSHYFAESSPVVLTEAMSFQLPIVATNWRGIPDVVGESGGAFLVDPQRPDLVAERLELLLRDQTLREYMGRKNREWFCQYGTIERYRRNVELAILEMKIGRSEALGTTMNSKDSQALG